MSAWNDQGEFNILNLTPALMLHKYVPMNKSVWYVFIFNSSIYQQPKKKNVSIYRKRLYPVIIHVFSIQSKVVLRKGNKSSWLETWLRCRQDVNRNIKTRKRFVWGNVICYLCGKRWDGVTSSYTITIISQAAPVMVWWIVFLSSNSLCAEQI